MADIEATTWHAIDASNTDINPLGWAGAQLPSKVLDTGRAMMGATKRQFDRTSFTLTSAGTSTALTLTPSPAIAGLLNGQMYGFIAGTTCIAGATLNVNAKGAKNLKKLGPAGTFINVEAADFPSGAYLTVVYNLSADAYIIVGSLRSQAGVSGTFTPAITFGGAAVGLTYTSQVGVYYRIGNIIFFEGVLQINNKGSSTGAAVLTGLPTASAASPALAPVTVMVTGVSSAMSSLVAGGAILGYIVAAATEITLLQQTTTAGASMTNSNFNNGSTLTFSGFYFA